MYVYLKYYKSYQAQDSCKAPLTDSCKAPLTYTPGTPGMWVARAVCPVALSNPV